MELGLDFYASLLVLSIITGFVLYAHGKLEEEVRRLRDDVEHLKAEVRRLAKSDRRTY